MITIGLTFAVLLVLGAPIAFCIGISALASLLDQGGTPLLLIPHMMFQGTDSFPLLAVPFFILAGALMNAGGITRRLVEFVNLLVGHIRGGLALVTVVASMIFAGITGAAVAEASAIGSVLIPAMREEGYEIEFTAAVVAASSALGPIIPPSIPMIIYGVSAEQSIAALFLAGVIPGFENHFWQAHVPLRYAEARGLPHDVAHEELMARYHARAGTLEWYSVDFWATELELDIMRLKEEVAHLIAVHPSVTEFLGFLRAAGKRVVLATNAHHKSLTLKMARTGLEPHFDLLVTSHELGVPKEAQAFWEKLRAIEPFDPARTVLVDDSLSVLDSARGYGIRHLVAVRTPDTRLPPKDSGGSFAIDSFAELIA